jgi:hypothetical protein
MSISDQFPRRMSRPVPAKGAPAGSTVEEGAAAAPQAVAAPGSWPWRRVARLAAPLALVVLLTGMIGQVTHTAVFFLPALAAMTGAALRPWREGA